MTGCSGHRGCGRWDLGDPSRCSGLRDHKLDPWSGGCGRRLGHRGCCSGGRGGLGCCCCYYGCGSLGGLAGGQWTRPGQTGDGGADQGKDFDSGVLPNFCSFAKTQPVKRFHSYIPTQAFFVRNPSHSLQRKCGTRHFWRFENEFQHFKNEFQLFENQFHYF